MTAGSKPVLPAFYRAQFSYLLRHPWQLSLALLGICIGVAVIVAVDLANTSARKAFLMSMDAVTGEASHQLIGGPLGIDESLYAGLRVHHGIRTIAPVAEGTVQSGDLPLRVLGVDIFAERDMRAFTRDVAMAGNTAGPQSLIRELLAMPGAVMMSPSTAAVLGLSVGDAFEVVAAGRPRTARLIATFEGGDTSALDNVMVADIATAQHWLDRRGRLTRIDVRLPYGDDGAEEQLRQLLPPGVHLLAAAGRTRATADLSRAFMTNLTAMSLLALLIGVFLIYNSVSFSVLQRRPLIGVLRALGITRRQVVTLVLAEAAAMGLVASLCGLVAGIWLGERLLALVSQSINDLYFRVSVNAVTVGPVVLLKGLLAGLGATLLAATLPAMEAARCKPRLAMTRSVIEYRTRRLLLPVTIIGLVTMVAAGLLLRLSGQHLVAGLIAVFMIILGFALCVPLAVRSLALCAAPLAARLGGTPARLAVAGIAESLSRTGVAVVALAIAVSATIGISVMVDSFRGSVKQWLDTSLQADLYVSVQRGSLRRELIDDVVGIDGIVAFSSSRLATLEDDSGTTRLLVIDMAPGSYAGTELLDADPAKVWPDFDNEDVVLASEPYAYRNGIAAGDGVMLATDGGKRLFRVAAIYQSYDMSATGLLMSRSTYDRHWHDPNIDALGLYLNPAVSPADVTAQIERLAAGRQQLRTRSNATIREGSLAVFDRTFIITDVLYWLASGVAFIGILAAMLALQLERSREFALLRALGMTPRQLGGMVTAQTGLIGLLSGIAALPLGIVMAWVLINVINRRAFGWHIEMGVEPQLILQAVSIAAFAALAAGIYPAWRATRGRPALAMREE